MYLWKNRVERAARNIVFLGSVFGLAVSVAAQQTAGAQLPDSPAIIAELVASTFPTRSTGSASANSGAARSTEPGWNRCRGAYACRRHRSVPTRGRGHCARQTTPHAHHRHPDCRDHRSRGRRRNRCWPNRSHREQASRSSLGGANC
jgi:hypothetical protein